jgi:hypothetical protein
MWYQQGSSLSGCHLFPSLKQNRGGRRFEDDYEVETVVTRWLITQDTDWCQQATEKLVRNCDKWLSFGGKYVEV